MKGVIKTGYLVGDDAAQTVSLGWIPDRVTLYNLTDGDLITIGVLGGPREIVPFSGGGTTEIAAGAKIKGATSGATAWVREVLLDSGTWAGGDAAGFFVVEMIDVATDFTSENVYIDNDATSGTDDATVTANVNHNVAIAAAAASATGNSAISRYEGTTSAAKGFTIGSTLSEDSKLLFYEAVRGDE